MATGYGQFCPVSKACEILCQRWAMLVVRELLCGSRRFGDLQRGVPGCPPATLSKRLRELERAGIVDRIDDRSGPVYELTEAGHELLPVVDGLGTWAQRWVRSAYGPEDLDADFLLWDVRRNLTPGLAAGTVVIELQVRTPAPRRFWIVVDPDAVDLCLTDPQRTVDVVLSTDVRSLTKVWMGDRSWADVLADGTVSLAGPAQLVRAIPGWFGQHPLLAPIAPARA